MSLEPADADRRLDVREVDGEPFNDIMGALNELEADESLLLINSFEPEPLYDVLAERGFAHDTEQVAADEYHVRVTHAE